MRWAFSTIIVLRCENSQIRYILCWSWNHDKKGKNKQICNSWDQNHKLWHTKRIFIAAKNENTHLLTAAYIAFGGSLCFFTRLHWGKLYFRLVWSVDQNQSIPLVCACSKASACVRACMYMCLVGCFFTADGGVCNIKACDILIERACN